MRIYGLDFTSAPRPSKPITLAAAVLDGEWLAVESLLRIPSFDGFERCLDAPGRWIAAFDLPFGQPRRLVEALGWPTEWQAMVGRVAEIGRDGLVAAIEAYKADRRKGDKEHLRVTDRIARSLSPMKLYGVPLAKMFFEGATRLAASELHLLPCRPTGDRRIAVEGYPGMVARSLIGRRSYKAEARAGQTRERLRARRELVGALASDEFGRRYGARLALTRFQRRELVDDPRGDLVDAVLCAAQAAWAHRSRRRNHGLPRACDPLEGWIVDPGASLPGAPAAP